MERNLDGSYQIDSRPQLIVVAWAGGFYRNRTFEDRDPLYYSPSEIAEHTPLVEVSEAYGRVPANQVAHLSQNLPTVITEIEEFVDRIVPQVREARSTDLKKLPLRALIKRLDISGVYGTRISLIDQLPYAAKIIRSSINENIRPY